MLTIYAIKSSYWKTSLLKFIHKRVIRQDTTGGATFGDKMNLSNTPNGDSVDAEIAAEGANVIVTWWERNQTSNTPVARISTDGGETFGAMMMLATNGTISSTAN